MFLSEHSLLPLEVHALGNLLYIHHSKTLHWLRSKKITFITFVFFFFVHGQKSKRKTFMTSFSAHSVLPLEVLGLGNLLYIHLLGLRSKKVTFMRLIRSYALEFCSSSTCFSLNWFLLFLQDPINFGCDSPLGENMEAQEVDWGLPCMLLIHMCG